jgi:hypothetical protein
VIEAMMEEILEEMSLKLGALYFLFQGLLKVWKGSFQLHQTWFYLSVLNIFFYSMFI